MRPDIPEIETERLRLRAWRAGDVELQARLNADPEYMRHLGGPPMTYEQTAAQIARFRDHWARRGVGLWAAEDRETGSFLGRIGLAYHGAWPDDLEVGWALDPAVWGRGLATEGGAAAIRHGFDTLGAERIVSICTPENAASIRVMEKLGFRLHAETTYEGLRLLVHLLEREEV
jgi:RimJ/RimL family protein N-acetyltransferase